jgi:DNA polymerase-3 subunit delta
MAKKSSSASVAYEPSHRIIVLHGPERFLIEEHTRRFAEALDVKFGGIDQFNFDGETVQPATVLDELRSYGLMQKHKLVVLDNADVFLAGGAKDENDEEAQKKGPTVARRLMEKYAEHPVADATLFMRAATWRPGNLDKAISKSGGVIVACEALNEVRAAQWCMQRCAKRLGTTIDTDAAELLVQRLGPELLHLDVEMTKLASMVSPGKPITRELVCQAVELSREEKAWQIQDAIATLDPAVMLGKLTEVLQVSRQDIVPLNWAVMDLLRKMHLTAQMLKQGEAPGNIYGKARLWGDTGNRIMSIARRTQPGAIAQLLQRAIDTDRSAKSGFGEPVRSLEALLVTIADKVQS